MGCFERFLNWLVNEKMPQSEKSIINDLIKIGIIES